MEVLRRKERRTGVLTLAFKNNKGQIFLDIIVIAIILFVAGLIFVFLHMINSNITDALISEDDFAVGTTQGDMLKTWDNALPSTFDNAFIVMFILLWVFVILSSIFIDSHPVFIVISFILLIVLLSVVGVLSNSYESFIMEDGIYTFASSFPKINYVMEHLVMFLVFMSFSGLIAVFGKNRWGV